MSNDALLVQPQRNIQCANKKIIIESKRIWKTIEIPLLKRYRNEIIRTDPQIDLLLQFEKAVSAIPMG
jgi:hypothetical protein